MKALFSSARKRMRSLTYFAQFLTILLGVIEVHYSLIQSELGINSGWTFILIATINMYIRERTVKPISEK